MSTNRSVGSQPLKNHPAALDKLHFIGAHGERRDNNLG
jgi:hypothetical protein